DPVARRDGAGTHLHINVGQGQAPAPAQLRIEMDWRYTGLFPEGSMVKVRVEPAPGARFVRWGGGCEGQPNPCSLALTGALSVTAMLEVNCLAVTVIPVNGA